MGDAAAINETFPDITIDDLAAQKPNVVFRKCGDAKKEAGVAMSRECDNIVGSSLSDCIGPSGKDCTVNIKDWSILVLASFYGYIKNNQVMDDFKASQIFFDQTKVTVAGLDNRDGQDAKKSTTISGLGKVLSEIVMRKEIGKSDYELHKVAAWKDLKFSNTEA